jgi:hypothetical protein
MTTLRLYWNFDKPYYFPLETATISIWAENIGSSDIYISDVATEFNFSPGLYNLQTISGRIPSPNTGLPNTAFLGTGNLQLPSNIVGPIEFTIRYKVFELRNGQWIDYPLRCSRKYMLNIFVTPVYKLFLSRGTHFEDRQVGDQIAQMIREWGFDPVTVGIDIDVPDNQVNSCIDFEIQNSCGLIAIATPRVLDYYTQTYRTLEWLHSRQGWHMLGESLF